MRTFAAVIKVLIFLMAVAIGSASVYFDIKVIAYLSILAMFLLFICQAAEIFLGVKK